MDPTLATTAVEAALETAVNNPDQLSPLLAVFAGLGLSASAGFRVFVPLFALSIAANSGMLELSSSLDWVGSWPAMIMLGVACVVEIAGYYIPWVDNALDTIATPGALASGTMIAASVLPEMGGFEWALAALGGGGSAGVIQGGTVMARAASTATSGGVANPVVSTGEAVGSIVASILAFMIPIIIGGIALIMLCLVVVWWINRRKKNKGDGNPPASGGTPDAQPAG